jgi:hypothetical protein
MTKTLDLSRLAGSQQTIVLSGKDKGVQTRIDLDIDTYDANGEIDVILPKGLAAMTPSFILGLFGSSVKKCGTVESFLSKYRFSSAPDHLMDQIRRGAAYSLVRGTPF